MYFPFTLAVCIALECVATVCPSMLVHVCFAHVLPCVCLCVYTYMLALLLLTWCLERWSLGLRCSAKIGRFIRAMWWLVLVCVCACESLCVCLCVFAHARSCVHVLDRLFSYSVSWQPDILFLTPLTLFLYIGAGQASQQTNSLAGAQGNTWVWCCVTTF